MIISERDNPIFIPSPSVTPVVPVTIDTTPISSLAMIAIKIYAFGGLAFMFCVVLGSLGYWFWIVVIKREYADSPPYLDLHPERMREREKARIARLKRQKEEKLLEKKRKDELKFTPPPIRIIEKQNGRNRSSSLPIKPAMRKPSVSPAIQTPRKSSLANGTSPCKNKRVSWASSVSTLDMNGKSLEMPVTGNPKDLTFATPTPAVAFGSPFPPLPMLTPPLSPALKARTSIPRLSYSVEPRSLRGTGMIAATTPDIALSWAQPSDPSERVCNCSNICVGPFDMARANYCDLHRYRDEEV